MDKENNERELVSIHCMTYNHKNYIKKCLDGFVMQKTNFKFIAYVGDDCSEDGTEDIVREYEKKYPDIIKGIYHKKNTKAEGNFFDILKACKGKYLAICEGDDYWTDEYKLQKQIDFLENNPEYSICFHKVVVFSDDKNQFKKFLPTETMILEGFTFENLLKYNFIQTNSVVYRNSVIKDLPGIFPRDVLPGDWYLNLLFAQHGKIKYFDDITSVYCLHNDSVWGSRSQEQRFCKYTLKILNFYINIYKNIAPDKKKYMRTVLNIYSYLIGALINRRQIFRLFLLIFKHPVLFLRAVAHFLLLIYHVKIWF